MAGTKIGLAVLAALQAAVAGAQVTAQLDEIVVTAQKREESLQDVPIAISALAGRELAARGVTSSDDLQRLVPSLTFNPAGGAGSVVGLRGIIDVNFTTGQVGSVAIVADDVGLNSPAANTFALLDLERIEVLRGPQVTLYGRSTTGGAINFISRRPRPGGEFEGEASLSLGNLDAVDFEAAVSLPLGERAGLRLAALSSERGNFITNPTLDEKEGHRRRQVGRISLVAELSDTLHLYATLHGGRQRADGSRYKDVGYFDPADVEARCSAPPRVGNGCADAFGFVDSGDYDRNYSNVPGTIENIDMTGGLLNLTWKPGSMTFSSLTAFEQNEFSRNEDTDGGPANFIDVSIDADTDQFTQEFRLASADDSALRWLVGVYYLKEQQRHGITTLLLRDLDVFISTAYDLDDEIYSGYAQLDFDLGDRWSVTAGARYSEETKDGTAIGLDAFDNLTGRGLPPLDVFVDRQIAESIADPELRAEVPFGKTWRNWGGKLGLNFTPSQEVLVYGYVSRSFKGGVFNLAAGPVLADPGDAAIMQAGVNPEKLWTYELGAKMTLLDGRMQLNLATFYNDYTDQQLYILGATQGIFFINAAAATIKGLEADLRWKPVANTTVTLGLGYLDGSYDELVSGGVDLAGNDMILVPEVSAQLGLRQEWPAASGRLAADISLAYRSSMYFDIFNTLDEDAHTTANVRLEYTFGGEQQYSIGLWGRNITDERFIVQAFDLGTGAQALVNDPRTYGVSISARF